MEAQLHQDLPFEKLVDILNIPKDTSRHPIFQIQFGVQSFGKVSKFDLLEEILKNHKKIASAIQQMWKEHLGVTVQIENQEWKVFLGNLERFEFQMARMGWIGDYVDPNTFLELFASANGNNHSNWKDSKFDEMLNLANAEPDQAKRMAMLREVEEYALERQPLIPIYLYTRANMVKPYVRGLYGNYQDRHLWKYVWIDERWKGEPGEEMSDNPLPELPEVEDL